MPRLIAMLTPPLISIALPGSNWFIEAYFFELPS